MKRKYFILTLLLSFLLIFGVVILLKPTNNKENDDEIKQIIDKNKEKVFKLNFIENNMMKDTLISFKKDSIIGWSEKGILEFLQPNNNYQLTLFNTRNQKIKILNLIENSYSEFVRIKNEPIKKISFILFEDLLMFLLPLVIGTIGLLYMYNLYTRND